MRRTRRRRRPSWSRRTEARTLALAPADPAEAARAFAALDFAEQMALVREVAATRGPELCRAYRAVVAVCPGVRLERPGRGPARVVREPCVTLVVKAKRPRRAVPPAERLPPALLAGWTVAGARQICAVPTDVQDGRARAAIRPEGVLIEPAGARGAVACVIDRASRPGEPHVIGCRHVFSPPDGGGARIVVGGLTLGTTSAVRGRAGSSAAPGLDAQLGQVTDRGALKAVPAVLRLQGVAASLRELEVIDPLWILTPGGAVRAHYLNEVPASHGPDYEAEGLEEIVHELLVLLQVETATARGDSGSPVTTRPDGGTLLGMHIAGNPGERLTFMIPAWHLLDPTRYVGAEGETWALV